MIGPLTGSAACAGAQAGGVQQVSLEEGEALLKPSRRA